jgi:septation ring formation regulator EzrA
VPYESTQTKEMTMEYLDIQKELDQINAKLDLINQTLLSLFEQLEDIDKDEPTSLYNDRDQTQPL